MVVFPLEIVDFSTILLSNTNISVKNMYHRGTEPVEGFTLMIHLIPSSGSGECTPVMQKQ